MDAPGVRGMTRRLSPEERANAQALADLHEELVLRRYPTCVAMARVVREAAERAESLARLDRALHYGLR